MKTLTITVGNTFLNNELAKYIFAFDPTKAMFGWYSDFWRKIRISHANISKIDKNFIRAKITYDNAKTDRIKIILPSGAGMDIPSDLRSIDCDIILLHLKALQLAKNGYKQLEK